MAGDYIYQVSSAVFTVFLLLATANGQVARDGKYKQEMLSWL